MIESLTFYEFLAVFCLPGCLLASTFFPRAISTVAVEKDQQ